MTVSPDGLHALLKPRGIAILGASEDLNKLNGRPLKFLIRAGYKGRIYPINPKYAEIAGIKCYPDLESVPDPIDLAIVGVPARAVLESIRAVGKKGVPSAIVFASGFGEMGAEGARLERELVAAARAVGVRVLGPNGLGLINAFEGVLATFSQYGNGETPAGPIGFVTQSGALGTAIAALARSRGLGLGYFVNTGNEADVTFVDAMGAVLEDARIKVGTGYIEGLKDGEGFCRLARHAAAIGKPLVVTKVGRTKAGARAASSHTGSLAGEDAVFDAVVRQFGVIRARNESQMLDFADLLATTPLPDGRGVAIITQSGGAGVMMADRAEELGLDVPVLGDEIRAALKKVLPPFGALLNPVDVTAQFIAEPTILKESVHLVLEDPKIAVAIIWFQLMTEFVDSLVAIFTEIKKTVTKPFVVSWVAGPEKGVKALRDLGICVLTGGEPAVDAIAAMVRYAEARRRLLAEPPAEATRPASLLLSGIQGIAPTIAAAEALASAGIPLAKARLATSSEAAVAAAAAIGYPVVMKIESPDLPHKTEAGGVKLGLKDADAVRAAYGEVVASARRYKANARVDGVVVQEMASGVVECVVGLRRDPAFGMIVMAGLGGIFIETLKDVVFRKAPVSETEARLMLAELKGAAVLGGARGRPAVDGAALARLIAAVSCFGAAHADRLQELDLNPVLASPAGAVAVDWLMVLD
jgi:acetyltransferase